MPRCLAECLSVRKATGQLLAKTLILIIPLLVIRFRQLAGGATAPHFPVLHLSGYFGHHFISVESDTMDLPFLKPGRSGIEAADS